MRKTALMHHYTTSDLGRLTIPDGEEAVICPLEGTDEDGCGPTHHHHTGEGFDTTENSPFLSEHDISVADRGIGDQGEIDGGAEIGEAALAVEETGPERHLEQVEEEQGKNDTSQKESELYVSGLPGCPSPMLPENPEEEEGSRRVDGDRARDQSSGDAHVVIR